MNMEQIFSISQPWTINGIWSDAGNRDRPAVLFLSAGLLRSQGPNRLYVDCARELATKGISSLRFDLSGIGDSVERPSSASIEAKTQAEVREVLDTLERSEGISRFVLAGLCSGAHDAIEIAVHDERVVGVVSLDGYSVKTRRYKLHWFTSFVLPRLIQKGAWKRLLNLLNPRAIQDESAANVVADDLFLEVESPEKVINRFKTLLSRRVSLFCLFTGGVINEYSYCGQLADADALLASSPHLREVYFPEMDHLLLLEEDREKVIHAISQHIASIG